MEKVYNIVELFSGIGSQAKALSNIGVKCNIVNTCEWDIHAMVAYDAIHKDTCILPEVDKMEKKELIEILSRFSLSNNGKNQMTEKAIRTIHIDSLKRIYTAILRTNNAVDVCKLKGKKIKENVDILTYSFPCQDLSNVGAFHGYNRGIDKGSGSRSSLLWEVGRILRGMENADKELPRFLVLENVPSLLSKRHKANFEIWQTDLEKLGYHNKVYLLNASSCGIPQNRPRLIMISTLIPEGNREHYCNNLDDYYKYHNLEDKDYIEGLAFERKKISDLLKTDYECVVYLEEAKECQPNNTASRMEIWENNPKIVDENGSIKYKVVRTITTKQDRNPNSGNIYFDYAGNIRSKFRYLTPRECFLFMGFEEADFERVLNNNPKIRSNEKLFTRDKLIRMAGNSIPVNLLERIFEQIVEIDNEIVSQWKY